MRSLQVTNVSPLNLRRGLKFYRGRPLPTPPVVSAFGATGDEDKTSLFREIGPFFLIPIGIVAIALFATPRRGGESRFLRRSLRGHRRSLHDLGFTDDRHAEAANGWMNQFRDLLKEHDNDPDADCEEINNSILLMSETLKSAAAHIVSIENNRELRSGVLERLRRIQPRLGRIAGDFREDCIKRR